MNLDLLAEFEEALPEQPKKSALQPSKAFDIEGEHSPVKHDSGVPTYVQNDEGIFFLNEKGEVTASLTDKPDYTNMPQGLKEAQQLNGVKDHGLENVSFHPEKSNLVPVDTAEVKWEKKDDHYVTAFDPANISSKVIKGNFVVKGDRVVFEANDLGAFSVYDPNDPSANVKTFLDKRFPGYAYFGTTDDPVYTPTTARVTETIPATAVDPVLILAHEEYLKTHKGHVSFKRFRDEIYPNLKPAVIVASEGYVTATPLESPRIKIAEPTLSVPMGQVITGTVQPDIEISRPMPPTGYDPGAFGSAWLQSLNKMEDAFKSAVPEELRGPTVIMAGAIAPGFPPETVVLQPTPDEVKTEVLEKESDEEFTQAAEQVSEFYNASIQEESEISLKEVFQAQAETIPPPPFNLPGDDVIRLTILGDPQAQKRSRTRIIPGAKFAMHYDPSAGDKSDFLSIIQQHAPNIPWDCPVRLDVYFYFSRPKAHFNSKGEVKPNAPRWKTGKPDRDNLDKFVMDAMSKVYFKDDSYVCAGELVKRYDLKPRTEIVLSKLEL